MSSPDDAELPRGDDELVAAARAGDDDAIAALLTRYRGLARSKARSYYIAGADHDDVCQEALIGLYKAIRDYQPDRGATFRTFADMCITRQVISAVKAANRRKHDPLRTSVSLDAPAPGNLESTRTVSETASTSGSCDPAALALSAESIRELQRELDGTLSTLEADVLALLVDGRSYSEIAVAVGTHAKAVDNAIQRVRRKIREHLAATESVITRLG